MRIYSELISEIIRKKRLEADKEFVKSKNYTLDFGLARERYDIVTDEQSKFYNKDKGRYELISIPNVLLMEEDKINYCIDIMAKVLKQMLGRISNKSRILVVGLGNRHISSDSLGVKVVSKVQITFESKIFPKVMAICPSVLGLTGIETYDIISGVVDNVKPTHIILIDSLCASNVSRLGKSIQLSDSGLCPGSGVGNKRKCIDKSLSGKVISIGVPLLIYASTFVENAFEENNVSLDSLNSIMQSIKKLDNSEELLNIISSIKKIFNSDFDDLIVSEKDIEECVDILSDIISKAINISLGVNLN